AVRLAAARRTRTDRRRYPADPSALTNEIRPLTEELAYLRDDTIDCVVRELRIDRQRQDLAGRLLAVAQSGRAQRNTAAVGWVQMHGHGIVNAGADRACTQMFAQPVAILAADHVLM